MAAAVLDGVTGAGALDGVTALEEVAVCAGSAFRVPGLPGREASVFHGP